MPSFPSKPLVRPRDDGGLQLSYQLPHRVHTAAGYPLVAPNGSSIVVYGYETGLKVVWRGGKPFATKKTPVAQADKPQKPAPPPSDDAVMIIDSDDESVAEIQSSISKEEPKAQFEEEEPEVDPAYPYESILRQVDIPLGSRVLHLAVPRILPEAARSSLDPFPPTLKELVVVAAVCADYSTRVVTIPLAPPTPHQTKIRVQTISISGGVSHQELPRGVSVTFTYQETENKEQNLSRGQQHASGRWDLLVATHSAESAGLLLIHRIPIADGHRLCDDAIETKRRYLPAPATNISFNPSGYPTPRHSTLLVAFHSGCVKVYSCFATKRFKASRRSSSVQSEFETSQTEGKWHISLYPGFEQSVSGLTRRKTVISAEWVLGGRAIMVLMSDGEWGVWDFEGTGPGNIKGPLERQSSVQGVTGGSLTTFSVSGRLLNPLPSGHHSETSVPSFEHRPRFAPLTPSTKRVREDTLLKGGSASTANSSLCGGISVFQTNTWRDPMPDEAILLRHGNQTAVISSLLSLWRSAIKATGTFDPSNRCRVSTLQDVTFMGERLKGVGHLPVAASRTRGSEQPPFDLILTAEHRILILAPKVIEPENVPAGTMTVAGVTSTESDQQRLHKGELDVDGMDRLLSGMASAKRSIGIMGSPIKRLRNFT
ncbi:uncharacterized protein BO95DRAFT_208300 [Aspergillus brunneoviolaceus CBS 621.78]|uniref:Uncharacterized protein n=1 Tax=Aspergillus brunneoviolaceus CBS 621.78 TaxID=1450534 RepID=A0ACD1G2F5_9EURO|nr:hypothetical protein BO95DRAFT_208300 [Aspergillus brunneoviolaceus CBS 621.78]RAH43339.1 hypothetical protein BO95DRAFT_208300 [Aspergillus brunneoviolaceus CBS 621.78]